MLHPAVRISIQVFLGAMACLAAGASTLFMGLKGSEPHILEFAGLMVTAASLSASATALSPKSHRKAVASWAIGLPAITLVLTSIILPVLMSAKVSATTVTCYSNIKALGQALMIYRADFDDRLPRAESWHIAAASVLETRRACPESKTPYSYAMNIALSAVKIEDLEEPSRTVLLFEKEAYSENPAGGKQWFNPRHGGKGTVALADGSARWIGKVFDFIPRWEP